MPMNARLLRPRQTTHPEAAAWASRVRANGGSVSGATLLAVDRFCKAISAAGIRDRFLRLNLFCGTGLNACLVPLYRGQSLGGSQFGGTVDTNVSGLFVSGDYNETGTTGGLLGNGSTKYLNTGVTANATSTGNRHLCVYENARSANTFRISIGARSASPATYFEQTTFTAATTYVFRSSNLVQAATDTGYTATGAMMLGVDANNVGTIYRNGTAAGTVTYTNINNTYSGSLFVFAGNSDGSPTDFTNARIGGYSIGLSMTAAQAVAYYTAMQAFQTALQRNV